MFAEDYELCRRAETANDLSQYKVAQQLAMDALAINPNSADAYGSLARACLGQSHFVDAEQHCRQGLEMEPTNTWLLRILVLALVSLEKGQQALSVAQRLMELEPEQPESHDSLGRAYRFLEDQDSALIHFRKALELAPTSEAHFQLGLTLLERKRYSEAEVQFRAKLEQDPNDAASLNNLGVCLDHRGKKRDAALVFKAAVMLDPTLHIAKSNAKNTINEYTTLGGGIVVMAYLLAKLAFYVGRAGTGSLQTALLLTCGVLVAILIVFLSFRWVRRRNLASADPQIMEFYRAVCRDREVQ